MINAGVFIAWIGASDEDLGDGSYLYTEMETREARRQIPPVLWKVNEPDPSSGGCVQIESHVQRLAASDCAESYYYVCEINTNQG